ncbi:MAG: hypothetical protein HZB76_05640 [Chlamydiae bacterium]|nr:hypothetical protein [Chlamydiota bacterium]
MILDKYEYDGTEIANPNPSLLLLLRNNFANVKPPKDFGPYEDIHPQNRYFIECSSPRH